MNFATPAPAERNAGLSLDALARVGPEELSALYRGASTPRLTDVAGDLRGRMLRVLGLPGPLVGPITAFAGSRAFPWRGKSFTPQGHEGLGINRVFTDRLRLFQFKTSIGRSYAGDFDSLRLDYDQPKNPALIRAIEDEIRELRPGLWLGQAYLRVGGRPRLVLYFALSSR
jgi:hypothetical protein